MKKTKWNLLLAACLGMFLCSCDSMNANFKAYVLAHDNLFTANEKQLGDYIQADPALDVNAKATFQRRLDAERKMIEDTKKTLGLKQ